MIKVTWDIEECVALIDLYASHHMQPDSIIQDELQRLSHKLHYRADLLHIAHDDKFRNLAGMKMMYLNVVYLATNGANGLSATSIKLSESYHLFHSNPTLFSMLLDEFNRKYTSPLLEDNASRQEPSH